MSKMAKKQRRYRKWPAWQKESSGFDKSEKLLLLQIEYEHPSNNNQQLRNLCCRFPNSKAQDCRYCNEKYTRRSGALFACKNSVSAPRHCDARRASQAHGTLARPVGLTNREDFKSAVPPKVPTGAYADWYRRVSKKERKP
jgi:hypothetical protein